jgi:hypothetical protein
MQDLKLADSTSLPPVVQARVSVCSAALPRGCCLASPFTSVKFTAVSRGRGDAGSAP